MIDMDVSFGRELVQQLQAAGYDSVEAASHSRKDPRTVIVFIGWRKEPSWPDLEPWEMQIAAYKDGSKKGYVIYGRPSGAPSWTGHDRIEDAVTFSRSKTAKAMAADAVKRLDAEHGVKP
jgi:hypothetical protein